MQAVNYDYVPVRVVSEMIVLSCGQEWQVRYDACVTDNNVQYKKSKSKVKSGPRVCCLF